VIEKQLIEAKREAVSRRAKTAMAGFLLGELFSKE
jgi:hypothetical protein